MFTLPMFSFDTVVFPFTHIPAQQVGVLVGVNKNNILTIRSLSTHFSSQFRRLTFYLVTAGLHLHTSNRA